MLEVLTWLLEAALVPNRSKTVKRLATNSLPNLLMFNLILVKYLLLYVLENFQDLGSFLFVTYKTSNHESNSRLAVIFWGHSEEKILLIIGVSKVSSEKSLESNH